MLVQKDAPCVDLQGRPLLQEKHRIAMYPNGSGGIFSTLVEEGAFADLKVRNILYVYMCSVDNLLCKVHSFSAPRKKAKFPQ